MAPQCRFRLHSLHVLPVPHNTYSQKLKQDYNPGLSFRRKGIIFARR